MLPKISIVTPSFNQGHYIEQTIDSVLSQGYPNLEYVIIDGGSTDDTVDILRRYERHLAFWVSEKDRGQSHAINKGLQRTTGEIVAYLNSDDFYLPGTFHAVAELHRRTPGAGLLHGRCRYVDEAGNPIGSQYGCFDTAADLLDVHRVWWGRRQVVQPEVFWTRSAYQKVGAFREDLHYVMDYDYWLRILLAGFPVAREDLEYTAFRFQRDQKSNQSADVATELLNLVRPYLWDSATPLQPGTRLKLKGDWAYSARMLPLVASSVGSGESRARRWSKLGALIAEFPQLLAAPGLWQRIHTLLGERFVRVA